MRFGAMQWLLGRPDGVFEVAAELGLDGVELGFGENDLATDAAVRRATIERAAGAGVLVPSLCIGSLNRGGFSSDDPKVRAHAGDLVDASIDAAVEFGAKVVLVPFFYDAHPKNAMEMTRVIGGFRDVVGKAEAAGVTLGYEGELPAEGVLRLIESVGSAALGCYYDIGNAVWLGHDPLEELRQLRHVIWQVHVKEFTSKLNDRMLGEGGVPVPEACDVLREIGYDGWIVLETGTFGDPAGNTARQLAYLRQFI